MTGAVVVAGVFFVFVVVAAAVAVMTGAAVRGFGFVMVTAVVVMAAAGGQGVIKQFLAEELSNSFVGGAAVAAVYEDPGGLQ